MYSQNEMYSTLWRDVFDIMHESVCGQIHLNLEGSYLLLYDLG